MCNLVVDQLYQWRVGVACSSGPRGWAALLPCWRFFPRALGLL